MICLLPAPTCIAPATRAMLDRRIGEERMIALAPAFERPDWFYLISGLNSVPAAFVMDATGHVAPRWVLADEVDWSRAVAIRFETRFGNAISLEDLDPDEAFYL